MYKKKEKKKERDREKIREGHNVADTCLNTPFQMRRSIKLIKSLQALSITVDWLSPRLYQQWWSECVGKRKNEQGI